MHALPLIILIPISQSVSQPVSQSVSQSVDITITLIHPWTFKFLIDICHTNTDTTDPRDHWPSLAVTFHLVPRLKALTGIARLAV